MKLSASILWAVCFLTACNSGPNKEAELLKAKQKTIDSMKVVLAKQSVIDSMNAIIARQEAEMKVQNEEKERQVVANNSVVQKGVAPVATKKKWSHTAKGAVVGAGTGAVAGAIINKKRVEGALIGSLIGAGVGAGTGAVVDASKKKKNRSN